MSKEIVTVGCRLPHGITLRNPLEETDRSKDVTLKGLNKSAIINGQYVTTQVEAGFWDLWFEMVGKDFSPMKKGAIFVVGRGQVSDADVVAAFKDVEDEKTGFERMRQDADGVKKAEA